MSELGRIAAALLMGAFFMFVFAGRVLPKDTGQWNAVPQEIRTWFKGLKNGNGTICCDESDAMPLSESEWRITDTGKFEVQVGGRWFLVPDHAVLSVPNRLGSALLFINSFGHIFCFLPGSLS